MSVAYVIIPLAGRESVVHSVAERNSNASQIYHNYNEQILAIEAWIMSLMYNTCTTSYRDS